MPKALVVKEYADPYKDLKEIGWIRHDDYDHLITLARNLVIEKSRNKGMFWVVIYHEGGNGYILKYADGITDHIRFTEAIFFQDVERYNQLITMSKQPMRE